MLLALSSTAEVARCARLATRFQIRARGGLVRAEGTVHHPGDEFYTEERCYITELLNCADDQRLSIAQARVEAGVTTAWHRLNGVHERYVVTRGQGLVEVGDMPPSVVGPGDVVSIPPAVRQRITCLGDQDLVFLCVCTPRYAPGCYEDLDGQRQRA